VAMFVLWVISTVHHSLLEAHSDKERIGPPRHRSMHHPRML